MKRLAIASAALVFACALAAAYLLRPQRLVLSSSTIVLPADGALHPALQLHLSRHGRLQPEDVTLLPPAGEITAIDAETAAVLLQAPVNPGRVRLELRYRRQLAHTTVDFLPGERDRFNDGTPDSLRLHTRRRPHGLPRLVHRTRRPGRHARAK